MAPLQTAATRSARVREHLGHPVVDGDGHVIELIPVFADFVRDHGRSDIVEGAAIFNMGETFSRGQREMSPTDKRRAALVPAGWNHPTDTEYFATVTTPSRYYERLGETGIDFAVLYPTIGLPLSQIEDEEQRVVLCRLYNEFMAEQYRPYGDRFTMAATIPMHSPDDAIDAMVHAKNLGAKVALIPSYVRRPRPGESWADDQWNRVRPSGFGFRGWLDTFGLDSEHDYDSVWAKAIELGLPLAVHSAGMGFSDRQSISNFAYNGIGHFAAAGAALAKSLFFGGVTRRFPQLRVAVLEGGVAVGVEIYVRLVSFWQKRGAGLDKLNPANVDRDLLATLFAESDPRLTRYPVAELVAQLGSPQNRRDDFAATGVQSEEDIRDQFCRAFYWGCETDDPLVGIAFDRRITPLGARVPAIMGSDIGHWDVPEFDSPLAEAYELLEHGILDADELRDYLFTHSVQLYGSLNPNFFVGTTIEREAASVLQQHPFV
ncbi:MAG: amidohydrolase [Actinobacteria bacterium]|nr:MAG: amidohydrolase [Actinomycetota bacterium]